jgi:two-component system nitrate/nitrite response regulator NarL
MWRRQSFATVLIGKSILIREGIARILRAANFRTSASVSCAEDLPPTKLQPDQVLFLIVHCGDDFDIAVQQIELLRERHPGGRIAILADDYQPSELVSAFRAGANGYFVNVMTCDAFIKSIELVMMGETIFPPAFLSFVLDPERGRPHEATSRDEDDPAILLTADPVAPQLSPREQSILRCLIEGDSNKSIARKIDISEATVKVHVKAILRKIRVQNRTQAAIWGINNVSLTGPGNCSPLPLITDVRQRLPKPAEVIPALKKIEPSISHLAIDHDTGRAEVPRIERLIRSGTNRKANCTPRFDK